MVCVLKKLRISCLYVVLLLCQDARHMDCTIIPYLIYFAFLFKVLCVILG